MGPDPLQWLIALSHWSIALPELASGSGSQHQDFTKLAKYSQNNIKVI